LGDFDDGFDGFIDCCGEGAAVMARRAVAVRGERGWVLDGLCQVFYCLAGEAADMGQVVFNF
jgi:hypothetical protein